MSYRIHGLPLAPFRPLFALTDDDLEASGARRMVADAPDGAPCRVSLADADPGDRLILVNHRHLDDPRTPYRAEGPIFVREAATETCIEPGTVPVMLSRRLLSARVYDGDWMMLDADVVEGRELGERLERWFKAPEAATIHIHTARRGCFMAAATRS